MFETGFVQLISYATPETGWVLCDGTAYEAANATYAALHAKIGDTYNTPGTAAGWFCVPDLRGRTGAGATTAHPLGTSYGDAEITLGPENMPVHNHAMNVLNYQGNQLNPGGNYPAGGVLDRTTGQPAHGTSYTSEVVYNELEQHHGTAHANTIANAGGANVGGVQVVQPVSVTQPTLSLNYMIKL